VHRRNGHDHDGNDWRRREGLHKAERKEKAAATFSESGSHNEQSAWVKSEALKEPCSAAYSGPPEPTEQLLKAVGGEQQPEDRSHNQ
jgi:hypothetical protein